MMSQNRQEDKDKRIKSTNDYKVNLKSELIIQDLHKKVDILIENQARMQEYIENLQKR